MNEQAKRVKSKAQEIFSPSALSTCVDGQTIGDRIDSAVTVAREKNQRLSSVFWNTIRLLYQDVAGGCDLQVLDKNDELDPLLIEAVDAAYTDNTKLRSLTKMLRWVQLRKRSMSQRELVVVLRVATDNTLCHRVQGMKLIFAIMEKVHRLGHDVDALKDNWRKAKVSCDRSAAYHFTQATRSKVTLAQYWTSSFLS